MSETVSVPKDEYMQMKAELEALRNTALYKRLLEFDENIRSGKKYSRSDLGF